MIYGTARKRLTPDKNGFTTGRPDQHTNFQICQHCGLTITGTAIKTHIENCPMNQGRKSKS